MSAAHVSPRASHRAAAGLAALVTATLAMPAAAQSDGATESGATESGATVDVNTPGQRTEKTVVKVWGLPDEGADLNAGLPSSSKPVDPNQSTASFDLGVGPGGGSEAGGNGGAVTGDSGAGMLSVGRGARVPNVHTVKRGESLWQLSQRYFGTPYRWPQIWAMNPQVLNPHYLHPGDQIRLRRGGTAPVAGDATALGGGRVSLVPRQTVFLRYTGFIGDPRRDTWGKLIAAPEEKRFLANQDIAYLKLKKDVNVRIGQPLTIFRRIREPRSPRGARRPPGVIVAIKGTVKVLSFNRKKRIVRARVVEALDVIERGFKVGPVGRRFDVVPPKRSDKDVDARVLDLIHPLGVIAKDQVVFIDKGKKDGLKPGHRLRVLRRGDYWVRTLQTTGSMGRLRVRSDVPDRVVTERTPVTDTPEDFPDEIVGELRVLRTQKHTSLCLVTRSRIDLELGDRAVLRKGY